MLQIRYADLSHAADIADFQCRMALQTEHLKLNEELVSEAVVYIVKKPEYGQYLVPVEEKYPEKAYGSLLITYENDQSWWIQSVYVKEEYRRKGVFTQMFQKVIEKGKQKGARSVQLYVQKENERAKKTYQKLGMHCNGNQFFGLELVYGDSQVITFLTSKWPESISIVGKESFTSFELKQISGKPSKKNKIISVNEDGNQIGLCEYFYEFSDWRFGLIIYISAFWARPNAERVALEAAIRYLYQNCPLKVGAIRMISTGAEIKILEELMPKMHRDVYDIMQINL